MFSPAHAVDQIVDEAVYCSSIEPFRLEHGEKLVARIERKHVMAMLAKKADTPSVANNLRKRLGQLFDHAIALEWIKSNPARLRGPLGAKDEFTLAAAIAQKLRKMAKLCPTTASATPIG